MAEIAGKRTLEKTRIEQRINLKDYTNKNLGEFEKRQLGQAMIDRMVDRSEAGKDVLGKALPAYSKEYKNSEDFERYGKSANERNMELTGEMLDSIDLEVQGDEVIIKMEGDQAPKAHGNITGQEGKWKKKRDFFGVTDFEVKKILRETVTEEDSEALGVLDVINTQLGNRTSRAVFDDIFGSMFSNRLSDGES